MLEKLKNTHYMFHISTVFIIFPIAGVISGEYPPLTLFWTLLFVLAFYSILLSQNRTVQWLAWWVMIAYIFYTSVWLNSGFTWFIFYLSNLLIYELDEVSFHSWRFVSFVVLQPMILTGIYMVDQVSPWQLLFFLVTFVFSDALTFGLYRIRIAEELKEEKMKQNAKLNLFLAKNERNRIGQDLHDSLGHTFAMLSVKTDLALQLLQMQAYPQVEKELKEIHQISKDSMNEVRTIVENLKSRTLTSELETVKKMLEIAGIEVEIANQLDTASLTQELESTASMILLELVTNIIKHAKASKAFLKVERTEKELILTVRDNGCGFASIKGDEFHTVRDRVFPFSGEVKVISWKQPTEVQVRLPYKERN
ncbi:sensor histidine kinase [Streptococcus oralis]|uniref:histidine kinase n=1 Tax=Streptococcus oralis subsp. dentisani TaxID=1458253 RepID=A0A1X1IZ72_STROR|nr:sensor histidine kinase [Streptococcus oralis]ORO78349.1 two-component sensor histidine kinase [Streptococcus oralis subsp. dentisani]